MTEYERSKQTLGKTQRNILLSTLLPGCVLAGPTAMAGLGDDWPVPTVVVFLVLLAAVSFALHWTLQWGSATYRRWVRTAHWLQKRIEELRAAVEAHRAAFPSRAKGQQFKSAYEILGANRSKVEELLAVGMFREQREVFVTVFMRGGIAVRRTATMGSPYRCRPSDNPAQWPVWAARLGCDEILQYHNHPEHNGQTSPSSVDIATSAKLETLFEGAGVAFRSLIIFWNEIGEWKVLEYDGAGQTTLASEFDVALLGASSSAIR